MIVDGIKYERPSTEENGAGVGHIRPMAELIDDYEGGGDGYAWIASAFIWRSSRKICEICWFKYRAIGCYGSSAPEYHPPKWMEDE